MPRLALSCEGFLAAFAVVDPFTVERALAATLPTSHLHGVSGTKFASPAAEFAVHLLTLATKSNFAALWPWPRDKLPPSFGHIGQHG